MGKKLIIKGADFSTNGIVQIPPVELFDITNARRNCGVYAMSNTGGHTVQNGTDAVAGLCLSNYCVIPTGARYLVVSGIHTNGLVRFRFSHTTSDSESTTGSEQTADTPRVGNAGAMVWDTVLSNSHTAEVIIPTGYAYFVASIFRDTSGANTSVKQAAAIAADLSGVSIKAYF